MNLITAIPTALGWLITQFYEFAPSSWGEARYGIAIILLTLIVSFLMFPLTLKQTRSMAAMQEIQPEVKRLQREYKHDRQELNQHLMALYQERGVNPAAGCLPLIIQMPVWLALFTVLRTGPSVDEATGETVLSTGYIPDDSSLADAILAGDIDFLWMDLSLSPNEVLTNQGLVDVIPFVILVLIVMGSGYYQTRQTARRRTPAANLDAKAQQQQQQMQLVQKIMGPFLGVISWFWPAGLVLYFAVSNLFRVGQQAFILRLDDEGEKGGGKGAPDEGSTTPPKRTGPSPHASKKRKKRRRR